MSLESPDNEKNFPGLYCKQGSLSETATEEDGEKGGIGKRRDTSRRRDGKRDKKEKGYTMFEEEESEGEISLPDDVKSPSKSKKTKPGFKFPVKKDIFPRMKDEKRDKDSKRDDKKDKDQRKEEKRREEKEGKKVKVKDKEKKKSKHGRMDLKAAAPPASTCENPIFGIPLALAVERNKSHDGVQLPAIVRECIDYVEECGLTCEGIYRISGVKSKVQQLKDTYNKGVAVDLAEHEPNVVASLLKQFLRELPEPVLTTAAMPKFEEASTIKNEKKKVEMFIRLIEDLPACNRLLLSWMIVHMTHIIELQKENKMSLQNVSIVLSPTMQISHRVLNALFTLAHQIFKDTYLKKYVPPLRPATSRWSLELPDHQGALEEELAKQESLLTALHARLNAGHPDPTAEEQLWEVQRVVTQLKRKIKFAKKAQGTVDRRRKDLEAKRSSQLSDTEELHLELRQAPPPQPHAAATTTPTPAAATTTTAVVETPPKEGPAKGGKDRWRDPAPKAAKRGSKEVQAKPGNRDSKEIAAAKPGKPDSKENAVESSAERGEGGEREVGVGKSDGAPGEVPKKKKEPAPPVPVATETVSKEDVVAKETLEKEMDADKGSAGQESMGGGGEGQSPAVEKEAGSEAPQHKPAPAQEEKAEEVSEETKVPEGETPAEDTAAAKVAASESSQTEAAGDGATTQARVEEDRVQGTLEGEETATQKDAGQAPTTEKEPQPEEDAGTAGPEAVQHKAAAEGREESRVEQEDPTASDALKGTREAGTEVEVKDPTTEGVRPVPSIVEERDAKPRGPVQVHPHLYLLLEPLQPIKAQPLKPRRERPEKSDDSQRRSAKLRELEAELLGDSSLVAGDNHHTPPADTDRTADDEDYDYDPADDEELQRLVEEEFSLRLEEEELLAIGDELRKKIAAEESEIDRLQQEIQELTYLRHDSDLEDLTSGSDSSIDSEDEDDMNDLLSSLIQDNLQLEHENAEMCQKIHEERMICLSVKLQIRLLQQKQLESSHSSMLGDG